MKRKMNESYKKGLRERAEEFINENPTAIREMPPIVVKKLIEELHIHQVELEMQNEELRRSQLELEEARDNYADLYDFSPVGYFSISHKGMILEVNLTGASMLGLERGSLIGNPFSKFINRDDQDIFYHHRRKLIETKDKQSYELRLVKEDGSQFHALMECIHVRNEIGNMERIRTAITDITDHKQAEEALRESEERFRTLVEKSPMGVSLIGEGGHYKYLNPKFVELFEYTLEDIPNGQEWFKKAYPEPGYRRQVISKWIEALKKSKFGETRTRKFKVRCKDGSKKVILFFPVLMESREQIVIYQDVTEQEKLEAQVQRAQKMEAIASLGGGIAHDFNNLLMVILGHTSLMQLNKDSSHPDFEHLNGIKDQVERAVKLTNQLLGFAIGEKYEIRTTDINKIIEKSSSMFRRTKKEIKIHKEYEKNAWKIEADHSQLEQVLMNLYVNAWQAMPGGGHLYLRTQNVTLDENHLKPFEIELGKCVKLSVTDTGVGMDEATMQRIFEPFFTTKKTSRATGLGLSSSYRIIKNHGGFIDVHSEEGDGTTFYIYLPVSKKKIIEEEELSLDVLGGSETILLIDDEDIIVEIGEQLLNHLGYTVLIAKSGKEAIEIYKKNKKEIDMAVLGMTMPDMSGSDTYSRLKRISPDIKVLLSSGYSINGQAQEILDLGCNGFIKKPFNIKKFSQGIRQILDMEYGA